MNFNLKDRGVREPVKEDKLNYKQILAVSAITLILYLLLNSRFDKVDEKVNNIEKKIEFVLYENSSYRKSIDALNGTACATCHLTAGMNLPKSYLTMEDFKSYVRGTKRFVNNKQMPVFNEAAISDDALEKIYRQLYISN